MQTVRKSHKRHNSPKTCVSLKIKIKLKGVPSSKFERTIEMAIFTQKNRRKHSKRPHSKNVLSETPCIYLPRPIWIPILIVHFICLFSTLTLIFLLFGSIRLLDTVYCQIITMIYRIAFIRFSVIGFKTFFWLTKTYYILLFYDKTKTRVLHTQIFFLF